MADRIFSLGADFIFLLAMYGWGRLPARLCRRDDVYGSAYTVTLGLAGLTAIGGILNLVHLATAPVLTVFLAGGVALTVFRSCSRFLPLAEGGRLRAFLAFLEPGRAGVDPSGQRLVGAVILFLLLLFLAFALQPASSFNLHDDFHTYLARPVRMLATGTVGENPFDTLGVDSLGGQAFFQAFALLLGPAAKVNAFDAVLCSVLGAGLIFELGRRLGTPVSVSILGALLFVVINPHYANISALYSGSLMVLAWIRADLALSDALDGHGMKYSILAAVPVSLFSSVLISLKTTFVFMAVLLLAGNFVYTVFRTEERKKAVAVNLFCLGLVCVFLAPWGGMYLKNYGAELRYLLGDGAVHAAGGGPDALKYTLAASGSGGLGARFVELFSTGRLFYGNTYRDYLLVVLMLAVLGAAGMGAGRRAGSGGSIRRGPLVVAVTAGVANYFLLGLFFIPRLVVRYSAPVLLALAALSAVGAWGLLAERNDPVTEGRPWPVSRILCTALLISQVMIVVRFWPTFMVRMRRAVQYHTLLSFPVALEPSYLDYNAFVLSDRGRKYCRILQGVVPAGEKIFAWTSMPFHFDFARNRIYPTSEPGLESGWLHLPLNDGPDGVRRYFLDRGIRYLMWEYNGYGMKGWDRIRETPRRLMKILDALARGGQGIFNDGRTIILDLGKSGQGLQSSLDRGPGWRSEN